MPQVYRTIILGRGKSAAAYTIWVDRDAEGRTVYGASRSDGRNREPVCTWHSIDWCTFEARRNHALETKDQPTRRYECECGRAVEPGTRLCYECAEERRYMGPQMDEPADAATNW